MFSSSMYIILDNTLFSHVIIFSNIITCNNIIQYYMEDENFQKINIFELWSLHCLFMNVNSLWLAKNIKKKLLVVLVITCENIGLITCGLRPLMINPIFSLVITRTTRNIFQYFLLAMYYYLNILAFN